MKWVLHVRQWGYKNRLFEWQRYLSNSNCGIKDYAKKFFGAVSGSTQTFFPAIFPAVLLVIQGMSVSLDIYRTAVGCDGYTPQLKHNIQEANDLQKKLLILKDQVNLAWVPGIAFFTLL